MDDLTRDSLLYNSLKRRLSTTASTPVLPTGLSAIGSYDPRNGRLGSVGVSQSPAPLLARSASSAQSVGLKRAKSAKISSGRHIRDRQRIIDQIRGISRSGSGSGSGSGSVPGSVSGSPSLGPVPTCTKSSLSVSNSRSQTPATGFMSYGRVLGNIPYDEKLNDYEPNILYWPNGKSPTGVGTGSAAGPISDFVISERLEPPNTFTKLKLLPLQPVQAPPSKTKSKGFWSNLLTAEEHAAEHAGDATHRKKDLTSGSNTGRGATPSKVTESQKWQSLYEGRAIHDKGGATRREEKDPGQTSGGVDDDISLAFAHVSGNTSGQSSPVIAQRRAVRLAIQQRSRALNSGKGDRVYVERKERERLERREKKREEKAKKKKSWFQRMKEWNQLHNNKDPAQWADPDDPYIQMVYGNNNASPHDAPQAADRAASPTAPSPHDTAGDKSDSGLVVFVEGSKWSAESRPESADGTGTGTGTGTGLGSGSRPGSGSGSGSGFGPASGSGVGVGFLTVVTPSESVSARKKDWEWNGSDDVVPSIPNSSRSIRSSHSSPALLTEPYIHHHPPVTASDSRSLSVPPHAPVKQPPIPTAAPTSSQSQPTSTESSPVSPSRQVSRGVSQSPSPPSPLRSIVNTNLTIHIEHDPNDLRTQVMAKRKKLGRRSKSMGALRLSSMEGGNDDTETESSAETRAKYQLRKDTYKFYTSKRAPSLEKGDDARHPSKRPSTVPAPEPKPPSPSELLESFSQEKIRQLYGSPASSSKSPPARHRRSSSSPVSVPRLSLTSLTVVDRPSATLSPSPSAPDLLPLPHHSSPPSSKKKIRPSDSSPALLPVRISNTFMSPSALHMTASLLTTCTPTT